MSKIVTFGAAPAIRRSFPTRWLDGLRSYFQPMPSLRDPALARLLGRPVPTEDGNIVVTWENAFTFSAVFDAVNQLSNDVAKLPLNLHKRLPGGGSEPYYDSPIYDLLKTAPNPEMDTMMLRRTMQAHALTWHGGFAEIERNGLGRPVALWPLTPNRVQAKRDDRGRLFYEVSNASGRPTALDPKDVLHIAGLGFTPHCGYSTIELAKKAIGLALAAEQFGASFFENGSNFGGVLEAAGIQNAEQAKELQQSIAERHRGVRRAWDIMVAWGAGTKFTPNGVEPSKAQMNELRSKQVEEVARFFNMPVHKLKNLDRATNNNIEQQDLEYYKGPILNWITGWELELGRKLISPLERRQQFFKHNANAFLRGDFQSRSTALGMMRDKGIINADEWRELEDLNPQDGGQGKLYLVQSAQTPLNLIAELTQSQIDKNQAPPPAPPTPTDPEDDADRAALQARVERAEAAASHATAEARGHESARIAAEATQAVTGQELEAYRAREREAQALAAQLTTMAESLRAELAVAVQQRAEAETADAAQRADLQQQADETARALAAEVAARQVAEERAAAAERELERLRTRLAEADAELATAVSERDQAAAAVVEVTRTREALDAELATATAVGARLETIQAALEQAQVAERAAIVARDAAVSHAEAARSEAEAARLGAAAADTRANEQQLARVAAETRATDALTAATAANEALTQVKSQALEGTELLVSSHRGLFEHTMRLMVERETERARRSQQTPEKIRAWMATWYDAHRALMVAALTPAVRVHLAFIGSPDAPASVVAAVVDGHVAESKRQIEAVLDGSADALAPSLAQLLLRWETERPAAFADALIHEEMAYVRRRAA